MLTCLLLASQLHAASVAWYELPVAVDPHPVRYSYWETYHELYVDKTTGRTGSPVFREPMATSAVYYSLWDQGGAQPWLDDATAERWRDMALSSASIAAEALLWDTLDRSDELGAAVRFMRTFVSPNLELERTREGWKARANDPDIRLRPQLERRELAEGMIHRPPRALASLSLGSGLELQDLDALTERQRQVDAAVWLRAQRIGLDQLTLRGLALSRSWELSGRQHLVRGLAAAGAVSSQALSPLPHDWGTGLSLSVPRSDWWTLALRYHRVLAWEPQEQAQWSVRLTLRWLPPTRAPVQPGVWPLGQRMGARGPVRPCPPRNQPNAAGPLLEPLG
jgi:hypothetical protein